MAFSKIAAENLGGSTLPALAGGSLTGVTGTLVKITSGTVSSGASEIALTGVFTSTYKIYKIYCLN